ncbi:MAG: 2Fe-2S iron-sulfur cluster-binding protein [Chloroherpetonaceae bacterium]|nr:(2Fe-2S)-binding protein [Chloroherpetonaceae bacterium]MCS7211054.1 (2Fe-2S)-binding protein [Chloroherpetonaceae bacterium]MDW8018544.1 2Fe-2S iron-sulfur cluster-binding protein [Chloroherpetonaceae bacterium]
MAEICITVRYGAEKEEIVRITTDNPTGRTLQDLALDEGLSIGGACGGLGLCTTCRVQVVAGAEKLGKLTRAEKEFLSQGLLKDNERLACQISPTHDLSVIVEK